MLRQFLYLNSTDLLEYISTIEDGQRTEVTTRALKSSSTQGGTDLKIVEGSHQRDNEDEASTTKLDTDYARFDRLLARAEQEPEELGWIEVLDADDHLTDVGIGAMVQWECEIYVPETVKFLSNAGEMQKTLSVAEAVGAHVENLGASIEGLPDQQALKAMSGLIAGLNASLVIVGEDDESDWQIAGKLADDGLKTAELEGDVIVVGKVTKILKPGRYKPFLTFPGLNIMARAERRKAERTPPKPGKEDDYLHGPALMLNILAIYR